MSASPEIQTDRLVLRRHAYGDFESCVAMWSDPDVTRFIGGKPSSRQQTWMRLLSYIGHWDLMHFGYWVIVERATGDFVGEVGFADFKRGIASVRDFPEIGFALAGVHHGKGFATEAVRAALSWADVNLPYPKTVCMINPENGASLRVARKCGYEVFEQGRYNEQPVLFLVRNGAQDCP